MSTNIYWRPIFKGNGMATSLRFIFRNAGYFNNRSEETLGPEDIKVLKGIIAATTDEDVKTDCKTLIEQIELQDKIEIFLS